MEWQLSLLFHCECRVLNLVKRLSQKACLNFLYSGIRPIRSNNCALYSSTHRSIYFFWTLSYEVINFTMFISRETYQGKFLSIMSVFKSSTHILYSCTYSLNSPNSVQNRHHSISSQLLWRRALWPLCWHITNFCFYYYIRCLIGTLRPKHVPYK